ncbi:50S ribosomal protein L4 [Candidatus Spongiihabitans sp.]|uniref:50S ribosomal protein L4 n=1 Tax=Candidatus Spongiihabitans sp. TaxID=3101308 RepID=UPI003C6FBC3F
MTIQLKVNKLTDGKDGKVGLSDISFGVKFNQALVHQVVTAYQAGGRSGTRAQKNRAAVRGGGVKPWKQKGSGRARVGTIRSPIFVGGGRTFPASTQDFSQKVNKKMYRAAMRSILSELARQDRLVVVDELSMDAPKTKSLLETLSKLEAVQALIVLAEDNDNVELSARNLKSVAVCNSREIDPVSLIRYEKVVMTVDAAKNIDEAFQ